MFGPGGPYGGGAFAGGPYGGGPFGAGEYGMGQAAAAEAARFAAAAQGILPPGLVRGSVAGPSGYVYSTNVPERSPNYFDLRKSFFP
jgi:hypothetical protein